MNFKWMFELESWLTHLIFGKDLCFSQFFIDWVPGDLLYIHLYSNYIDALHCITTLFRFYDNWVLMWANVTWRVPIYNHTLKWSVYMISWHQLFVSCIVHSVPEVPWQMMQKRYFIFWVMCYKCNSGSCALFNISKWFLFLKLCQRTKVIMPSLT